MIVPEPLRAHRADCERLAHWPVGRAVHEALADLLAPWVAPAAGLRYDVIWCRTSEAVAALLAGDSGCSAEIALAQTADWPALYWPGYGVFLNGPLLAGSEGASFAPDLLDHDDVIDLLRYVLHEQAGHGFILHHTRLGFAQLRDSTWREALRAVQPSSSRHERVATTMRDRAGHHALTVEGWSEWVAERLLPDVCARLSLSLSASDVKVAPSLPDAFGSALDRPPTTDQAVGLLNAFAQNSRTSTRREPYDTGWAMFAAIEGRWGDAACAAATAIACGELAPDAPDDWPDARLLRMLGLRGEPGVAGLVAAVRNEFGWRVPVEWRARHFDVGHGEE